METKSRLLAVLSSAWRRTRGAQPQQRLTEGRGPIEGTEKAALH